MAEALHNINAMILPNDVVLDEYEVHTSIEASRTYSCQLLLHCSEEMKSLKENMQKFYANNSSYTIKPEQVRENMLCAIFLDEKLCKKKKREICERGIFVTPRFASQNCLVYLFDHNLLVPTKSNARFLKNDFAEMLPPFLVPVQAAISAKLSKSNDNSKGYIRGCYYTNWAQYRPGRGKFMPENYPPGLCTHLFYAFAVMNEQYSVIPFEWNDESTEWSKGMYERVNDLKKMQPDLKTLLSFGGWVFSQGKKDLFRRMLNDNGNRQTFIQSAVEITKKHKFDGFDLDYEYPEAEDKAIFVTLLRELSSALRSENLLFTAAVAAGIERIEPGYDIAVVAETLDFVNIMTYDLHGGWEAVTGLNSPLYDRNGDRLSVTTAVNYWENNGLPKSKIVVGFPAYGRCWTLSNPSQHGIGAAAGQATAGQFTREAGFLSYYEVIYSYLALLQ